MLRKLLVLLCAALALRFLPVAWCQQDVEGWRSGQLLLPLARGVAARITQQVHAEQFSTGSRQFNDEWVYGSNQMAVVGLSRTILRFPEARTELAPALDRAVQGMLSPEGRRFDAETWGSDPIGSTGGHAAWLGYTAFALGYYRLAMGDSLYNLQQIEMIHTLAHHLDAVFPRMLETYPDERYPVDNAAGIGALALYDQATAEDHQALIARGLAALRLHQQNGLMTQSVSERNHPFDQGRGSGTFLSAFFLAPADKGFSADLFQAGKNQLFESTLGFGTMREYRPSDKGAGDIDSGPIVLGAGVSATGFAIGAAQIHGDTQVLAGLIATMTLVGAPLQRGDQLRFATGGPLGDAILLAMLSAGPP